MFNKLFSGNKTTIKWKFESQSYIWNLKISENGFFVSEGRDIENKITSFSCISYKDGNVLWQDISFDEKWWIGIESIYKNFIFFHEYETPNLPIKKKIIAVDLINGNVLWQNDSWKFLFIQNDFIYIEKCGFAVEYFEVDIFTGNIIRSLGYDENVILSIKVDEKKTQAIIPQVFNIDYFKNEKKYFFMNKFLTNKNVHTQIEFFENKDFIVISFYEKENDVYANKISIFNKNKIINSLLFEDIVLSNANFFLLGAFFVLDDNIYYVKNKKELNSIDLNFKI